MTIIARSAAALLLVFACCPDGFAKASECEKAVAGCQEQCARQRIYNYDTAAFMDGPQYQGGCQFACVAGEEPCSLQKTVSACHTFYYRCMSTCPWTLVDIDTRASLANTNSFSECSIACGHGRTTCLTERGNERPRLRSQVDPCEEAQTACYTGCMPTDEGPSKYPEWCVKACYEAVTPCQNVGPGGKCKVFGAACAAHCPVDRTESLESTERLPGAQCREACAGAAKHCGKAFER